MEKYASQPKITFADLTSLMKAGLVGFLIAEAWQLSQIIGTSIGAWIIRQDTAWASFPVFCILCFLIAATLLTYAAWRDSHGYAIKLMASQRIDLLLATLIGAAIPSVFAVPGSKLMAKFATSTPASQLLFVSAIPVAAMFFIVVHLAFVKRRLGQSESSMSFFVNDAELRTADEDLLDLREAADRFADRLLNGGSADSIVFGMDAPWGIGKSTFLNFCVERLENSQGKNVIICRFNPLQYQDHSKLFEHFVNALVEAIQKKVFTPEIKSLIFAYTKLIGGKVSFTFFGVRFDPTTQDMDVAFENLADGLTRLNRKVIVIIDDLDRLNFSEIRTVLFSIKKSFMLPNISYVLCYDTENIAALQGPSADAENVREFLEKFVNVKMSLFLDASTLSSYISANFERALRRNLNLDPVALGQIKATIGTISEFCESDDFYKYQTFIGDIRKVKRLINTVLTFEIEKTEFETSDINKHDLIHLLLIYVNYPHIFRKIYSAETDGKSGFFSVVDRYQKGYPPDVDGVRNEGWRNSTMYSEYISKLTQNQRFLVEQVFSASTRLNESSFNSNLTDENRSSFACFNGREGRNRNLERHLNLIVKMSKPQRQEQYRFYLAAKDRLNDDAGIDIDEIFQGSEFALQLGEDARMQFWRVVVNSGRELKPDVAERSIQYLVDRMPDFSFLEIKELGLGLRRSGTYYLLALLDAAGWADEYGGHTNNTESNIASIAARVFGDPPFEGQGVIDRLMMAERGPLGLFDSMLFRFYCGSDRQTELFNLSSSLGKRENANAATSGDVRALSIQQMRQISQRIFAIFTDQYISKRINLLKEVDRLSLEALSGACHANILAAMQQGKMSQAKMDVSLLSAKSHVKSFIVYQLANAGTNSGVGCGYYDETGAEDQGGISQKMNDYLFQCCFTPEGNDQNNFEAFFDYLMLNYPDRISFRDADAKPMPSIAAYEKVLDRAKLTEYWREHRSKIVELQLMKMDKIVYYGNRGLSYRDCLPDIFTVLDTLLDHGLVVEEEKGLSERVQ